MIIDPAGGEKTELLRIAIIKGMTSPPTKRLLTMVHISICYICIATNDTKLVHNLKTLTPQPFLTHQASHFQNFSDLVVVIGGCSRNQARSTKRQFMYVSSE